MLTLRLLQGVIVDGITPAIFATFIIVSIGLDVLVDTF